MQSDAVRQRQRTRERVLRVIYDLLPKTPIAGPEEVCPVADVSRTEYLEATDELRRLGLVEGHTVGGLVQITANGIRVAEGAATAAPQRPKDQKFGVLDAPALLERDLRDALGSLGAALIYLDIDDFKQVNTRHTERVVDKTVLPQFQQLVVAATAGHGHAYAEGGDEVVVLLPNFSPAMASAFANDLLGLVRSTTFVIEKANEHLTISAGLAFARSAEDVQALPERANLAKRYSKENGRDRASIWTRSGYNPCPLIPTWPLGRDASSEPRAESAQPSYGTLDELFEARERKMRRE